MKGKRARNFTEYDKHLLLDIANNYSHIIDNKKTDTPSVNTKKHAWDKICNKFNANSQTEKRTVKQLHALYDFLKKKAHKNLQDDKIEHIKTGESDAPNSDVITRNLAASMKIEVHPSLVDEDDEYSLIMNESVPSTSNSTSHLADENQLYIKDAAQNGDEETENALTGSGTEAMVTTLPVTKTTARRKVQKKLRNLEILTRRIVDRKDDKDKTDMEIHEKRMQILELEELIKKKELDIKYFVYEKTKKNMETEEKIKNLELDTKQIENKIRVMEYKIKKTEYENLTMDIDK